MNHDQNRIIHLPTIGYSLNKNRISSIAILPLSPSSNSTIINFGSGSESGVLGGAAVPGYKHRYCWLQYAHSLAPGNTSSTVFGATSMI